MGSYDRMPEDYDGPAPEHVIQCNSKWSHRPERHSHPTVLLVQLCYSAAHDEAHGTEVWPCSWLLEGRNEDGAYTYECGLPTRYDGDSGGYGCAGGHYHVPMQVMAEQGMTYTDDPLEAEGLAKHGVIPLQMDGKAWF